MAKRINVILAEDVHREFVRRVPRGRRSAVLEEALREYLGRQRRFVALRKLESVRKRAPVVPIQDIVAQLRRDRGRA